MSTMPFEWHLFFGLLSFTWGACVGSFLNVCIHRIPRELSVVAPRSFCPHCKHPIAWYHNIPLFTYVMLRGRCAYCKARIVPRYVLVELLVAVLFLLIWLKYDFTSGVRPLALIPVTHVALVPIYWLMAAGLILGTFVDFEHLIIPDRVTLGGIVVGLVLSALFPSMHDTDAWHVSLMRAGIGAGVGWGLLWIIGVIGKLIFKKDAMGFGDVKLLGAIGAFLGWEAVLFSVAVSSLLGSIVGVTLIVIGSRKLQSRIPYGPYLAAAALLWILWGEHWWLAYLSFIRPATPML